MARQTRFVVAEGSPIVACPKMKLSVLSSILPILLAACGTAERGSLTEDLQAQLAPKTGLQLTGVQFYEEGAARMACGSATWEDRWGERQPERYFFARYAFPTKRWLADFDVYTSVDKPCREHYADVAALKQADRERSEAGQRRIDEAFRVRQEASQRATEEFAKQQGLKAEIEADARETQQAEEDQATTASDREAYKRAEEYEAEQQRRMREAVEEEQSR